MLLLINSIICFQIPFQHLVKQRKYFSLMIHWRLSTISKTSNKNVCSNVFWYVKVYIFGKFLNCTLHWDNRNVKEKFPSPKKNVTKYILFYLLQDQFYFNLRFLYELMQKTHLSKTMCGIFHFRFCLLFIEVYIFFNKKHGLFHFKRS